MKRKLIIAAILLLITVTFTACPMLQDCKMCATNTYTSGTLTIPGSEAEYCGSDLLTKEATPDITVGAQVIKVECY